MILTGRFVEVVGKFQPTGAFYGLIEVLLLKILI